MNKQAAKLAKTTALLNSTSIQLRISGLNSSLGSIVTINTDLTNLSNISHLNNTTNNYATQPN
jgi:hypothetical protein